MTQATETQRVLLIACGALAHETLAVLTANNWQHMDVQCLPANLHNKPQLIPAAVRDKIRQERANYQRMFVLYGDCGTGGGLDDVLAEEGVERLPGAHCYEFFAGGESFAAMAEAEPCTFYLTDFLAWHFDTLIVKGLGLDRHPQLLPMYFGNYRRLVYLAQTDQPERLAQAQAAATYLGLEFVHQPTGYGDLATSLQRFAPVVVAR